MVLFNYSTKEITAKIVYYGPGLCGKTTNLQFIYDALPSNNKSKMLSLATKADRTLFFDFLPLDLGKIRGMRTRMQLYTVPGQVYYNSTRQLVLKGADGVVFVADSQRDLMDANLESWSNLKENLRKQGVDWRKLPVVIQYNKRDLPDVLSVEDLDRKLNEIKAPIFESVATTGIGVEDTLKGVTRLVLKDLMERYGLAGDVSDDEIVIAPKAGASLGEAGGSVWDDDEKRAQLDDVQEVPFLMSEAPGALEELPNRSASVFEVTQIDPSESGGFAEAAVEVMADGIGDRRVSADGDDIVFDTIPEGAEPSPSSPKPFPAESLVVAMAAVSRPAEAAPRPSVAAAAPPAPAASPAPAAARAVPPPPTPATMTPRPPSPSQMLQTVMAAPPPRSTTTDESAMLVKEVMLPLNLTAAELAGKRRIVLKLQLEINVLR